MSSQTEIPGTFADYGASALGTAGGTAFSNDSNAGTTGASYATCACGTNTSNSLMGTNCGYSTTGTINGVTFSFKGFANASTGSSYVEDISDTLILGSPGTAPTIAANNYALTTTKWPTTATLVTYGTGTTDLFGSSLTTTIVNGSGFGFTCSAEGAKSSNNFSVNSMSGTVYYTSSSPPSAPTGLSLSYISGTSLGATWTNPSGTLTDNKIQISTDNSTWTTIDIGSVVTSYTFTGLTPNTLYYVQVAAVNSGGTSSYSTYAYAYTGGTANESITLDLISPDIATTGFTFSGAYTTGWQTLNSASDSNFVTTPSNLGYALEVTLQTAPSNLIAVTGVTINMRAKTTNASYTTAPTWLILRSAGGALTGPADTQVTASLTTSFANYTNSGEALQGTQALADWTGAELVLEPVDTQQATEIAEASITITYWIPAPLPRGGFNNSIMNSCGMASRW